MTILRRAATVLGLIEGLALPGAALTQVTATQSGVLDSLAGVAMSRDGMPSVSVAVGKGGSVIFSRAYGFADLEGFVLATPRTRYRTASISKWMTATLAMRLVEAGQLDLDAEIQRYCPQYGKKQFPISAKHLLTHTSGVRHYVGANGESERATTDAARRELEARQQKEQAGFFVRHTDVITPLDGFKDDPLLFEPGSRFQYTSPGYRLLGCVLQGAGGSDYSGLMGRYVFGPAGMSATRVDDAHALISHRAAGYAREGGQIRRANFRDVSENLPAGGHLSTAEDLVRFALAFGSDKLVRRESRDRMTQRPEFPGSNNPRSPTTYYGFGVNVEQRNGRTLWSHGGGQDGTSTILILDPAEGVTVAVMTNVSGSMAVGQLAQAVAEQFLGTR
jgi:CubicO group peptidase (beta-lactamase class C family)